MPGNKNSLPFVTKDKVLYFVTVYDFPKSTVRHQLFVHGVMVEKITTFEEWVELEAERIAARTQMKFGLVKNGQGQIALGALK
jgi:hypothetical protein